MNSFLSHRAFFCLCLFIVTIAVHSCRMIRPEIKLSGSVDDENEYEGGPSAIPEATDVGWNVAGGLLSSLPQNTGFHNDFVGETKPDPDAGFGIYSQLELIRKGSQYQGTHTHLTYLDISGNLVYYKKLADQSMIFGGLGPYIGYGLSGKASGNGFSENVFVAGGYKRFDAGLSIIGQYQLPSTLFFGLGYEFGLYNKSDAPDFSSRNRSLSLNIGYSLTKLIRGAKK